MWQMIIIRRCLGFAGAMGWWTSTTWGPNGKEDLLNCHAMDSREDVILAVAGETYSGAQEDDMKEVG